MAIIFSDTTDRRLDPWFYCGLCGMGSGRGRREVELQRAAAFYQEDGAMVR